MKVPNETIREDVVRVYEDLREALSLLAGKLSHLSFEYRHRKMAMAATQAAAELYKAVSHIKRSDLKSGEDVSFVKSFVGSIQNTGFHPVNFEKICLSFMQLYQGTKKEGHNESTGHLKGVRKYLKRLSNLHEKLDKR